MNARDKIYTGKVSEWGLPDGTVLIECGDEEEVWMVYKDWISPFEDKSFKCDLTCTHYKIKSIPKGYGFDSGGNIKRYWDGKEPLEVGMVVLFEGGKCKIELPADNELDYVLRDRNGLWVIVDKNDIKPVDTRAKKEKAIDDVMAELCCNGSTRGMVRDILSHTYDKWVGNDESVGARNKVSTKVEGGILTTSIKSSDLNISGGSDE